MPARANKAAMPVNPVKTKKFPFLLERIAMLKAPQIFVLCLLWLYRILIKVFSEIKCHANKAY